MAFSIPDVNLASLLPEIVLLAAAAGVLLFDGRAGRRRAAAIAAAAKSTWQQTPVATRADLLRAVADLYEANRPESFALLAREAGKSWADAVAEVREAVDFLRYYAAEAEAQSLAAPRGPFAAISPWNSCVASASGSTISAASSNWNASR